MTRRDKCHLIGRRASLLDRDQAAAAWWLLAGRLEAMGEQDIPKFKDLLRSVRRATIFAKKSHLSI